MKNLLIESNITEKICDAGVPMKIKGYRYLADAISMVCEDNTLLDSMMKGLYPAVAEKNDTTIVRVERDIRYAVEKVNRKARYDDGVLKNQPPARYTNKKFIASMAEKVYD